MYSVFSYIKLIIYCVSLYQHTPLHIAAGKGYTHTTECLIRKGADINMQDNDGVSTVHVFIK